MMTKNFSICWIYWSVKKKFQSMSKKRHKLIVEIFDEKKKIFVVDEKWYSKNHNERFRETKMKIFWKIKKIFSIEVDTEKLIIDRDDKNFQLLMLSLQSLMQMIMLIVTMLLSYANNSEYVKNYLIILCENSDFNQQAKLSHMLLSFDRLFVRRRRRKTFFIN